MTLHSPMSDLQGHLTSPPLYGEGTYTRPYRGGEVEWPSTGFGVRLSEGCGERHLCIWRLRVESLGCRAWGLGFRVSVSELRVWGLEFGGLDLEFGVWGLVFVFECSGLRV